MKTQQPIITDLTLFAIDPFAIWPSCCLACSLPRSVLLFLFPFTFNTSNGHSSCILKAS